MSIKISVIVPLYNVQDYVFRTIQSLEKQTIKDYIEVILVNDGSKDNTLRVVQNLMKNSKINYHIISKVNEGVSKTRNVGIVNARGKYLYFVDGDDYIHETMLEKMYKKAEDEKAEVTFCGYTHIEEGTGKEVMKVHKYIDKTMDGLTVAGKMLKNEIWIGPMAGFYLADFVKTNKITFEEDIYFGEDTVFAIKSLMNAKRVACVKEPLGYYFRRGTSITKSGGEKYFNLHESNLVMLNYNRKYFKDIQVEKSLLQYKIPQSIIRIFVSLGRSGVCKEELFNFVKNEDIKKYLKGFKINGYKENIKFKIASKVLLISPKLMYKLLSK
ncbi:glycosyltransferase family 2 protein [Hathewaya histolytica]|uniref:glycosyltransferase family 2 protein n=1 Tax=Hathewaya histolytica TaxID=1498 RepID=UPI003B6746AF